MYKVTEVKAMTMQDTSVGGGWVVGNAIVVDAAGTLVAR